METKINIPRRIGTSTRLIDSYVQELFTRGKITVKDSVLPEVKNCNIVLFERIQRRLKIEHGRIDGTSMFVFNKKSLTIKIKGVK